MLQEENIIVDFVELLCVTIVQYFYHYKMQVSSFKIVLKYIKKYIF